MSLDVWLKMPTAPAQAPRIYVREDGQTKEITRAEWDARYPGREPVVVSDEETSGTIFEWNITHNLGAMAREAGVYEALWRPEEIGITHAEQLIVPLRDGLALLQSEPERFTLLNPANGWGNYDGLVKFVAAYLVACERFPSATVGVWR